MEKRFSALITMLLIGVYVAFAQQTITVNGTVVAADNDEPVIGRRRNPLQELQM